MTFLNNTIPPPIVALFCALLTWAIAQYTASISVDHKLLLMGSGLLFIIGVSFDILAIVCFRAANTTINPLKPETTSILVTTGIYTLSRNPMYTGMAIILSAWSLYLGSITGLVGVLVFITYINKFQIKPEEEILSALFNEEFIEYKLKVGRWL